MWVGQWNDESEQSDTGSVDIIKQKTYHDAQSHGNVDDNDILTPSAQGKDNSRGHSKGGELWSTTVRLISNTPSRLDPDAGLNKEATQI